MSKISLAKFTTLIKELQEKFGKNKYPQSANKYLYDQLCDLHFNTLQIAIGKLCATKEYAPTLSDIQKAYEQANDTTKADDIGLSQDELAEVHLFQQRRCNVRVKQLMAKGITMEMLQKYYAVWLHHAVSPTAVKDLEQNGMPINLFWRIAIEDLFLCNANSKAALERARAKKKEPIPNHTFDHKKAERLLQMRDMSYFYKQHKKQDWTLYGKNS